MENIIEGMHLVKASKWKYDPHSVIYNMRKDIHKEAHKHEPNPELEKVENQDTYEQVEAILYLSSSKPEHTYAIGNTPAP